MEGKQLVEADLRRPVLAAEAGSRCEAEAALLSRPVPVSLILAASACNNQHRVTKPVQLRHTRSGGSGGTFYDFMDISQMFLNVFELTLDYRTSCNVKTHQISKTLNVWRLEIT